MHSKHQKPRQSEPGPKNQSAASGNRPSHPTTRTSGAEERSCRVCGSSITGRRRNGFCGDRCRMRLSRTEKAKRLQQAVTNVERAFEILREELGLEGG